MIKWLRWQLAIVMFFCLLNSAYTQTKKHPCLFYTSERINVLKQRIGTDTMITRVWNDMKTRAASSNDAELLTLMYNVTGEQQYAEKAKAILVKALARDAWDGMDDRAPRWNAGLGTSHQSYVCSIVFDGIYDFLTKEERTSMAQKIVKLGIEPSLGDWLSDDKRIHSLNSMGHNWWSAVVFEAGIASLAVMNEIPEAKDWAEEVMQSSKEWFAFAGSVLENKIASFDSDGGFYESVSYTNYGLSEYLLFRLAYTNALHAVKMPYDDMLQKTVDWFINACYPNSKRLMSLNFGDSNDFANGDRPAKLMIALGMAKERYYWYLNHTEASHVNEDMHITTPLGLLYQPGHSTVLKEPGIPPSAIYHDIGWGMLRSSWDKDATLLGVKCGYTWNHSHADAGSFVLYHKGQNLLIDGGDVNYALPEYSGYYVRSEAHNVMLFNGKAQDPQDEYYAVKNPGHLYNLVDGGNLKYMLADAQGPTSRFFLRNYRNFLWIGNVILIIDDIKTYEAGKFEFLLHFQDTAIKKGPDIEVSKEGASILFRPLFPETLPTGYPHDFPDKMKLEQRIGLKDRDAKTKIPYYAISPAEDIRQTKFINAIILLDDSNKPADTFTGSSGANAAVSRTHLPKIERLEANNMIGVRITQQGKVTDVFFNLLADGRLMHRNANNVMNGWETDAYIMAVTYPEKADTSNPDNATAFFISNGSYVRKQNKTFLHSLSKVFMYAEKKNNKMDVLLQGQPLMHVLLRSPQKPQQLLLNGKNVPVMYKGDKNFIVMDNEAKE